MSRLLGMPDIFPPDQLRRLCTFIRYAIIDKYYISIFSLCHILHTESATELSAALQLEYNKVRQQSITSEMLDIAGGAEALAQG